MKTILAVENFSSYFEEAKGYTLALRNVNMHFEAGEIVGIAGESGSGKSVLAKAMIGFRQPDQRVDGQIIFFDEQRLDMIALDEQQLAFLRREKIFYLPQDSLNVLDELYDAPREIKSRLDLTAGKNITSRSQIDSLLKEIWLGEKIDSADTFKNYSGGQKQKTLLGQIFRLHPRLTILDEPTTAIDRAAGEELIGNLNRLKSVRAGMAIILISHDLALLGKICDRIYVMYGGEVMESGPRTDILQKALHPYSQLLIQSRPQFDRPAPLKPVELNFNNSLTSVFDLIGQNNVLNCCSFCGRCPRGRLCAGKSRPDLIDMGSSRQVRCYHPNPASFQENGHKPVTIPDYTCPPLLTVRKLTVRAGNTGRKLISDIDLDIWPGDRVGLVGGSGVGKTTIIRTILQLDASLAMDPVSCIEFDGRPLDSRRLDTLRWRIQYVPQVFADTFLPGSSAEQALMEAMQRRSLHWQDKRIAAQYRDKIATILDDLGLTGQGRRRVEELSGGQKQRVALGRALVALDLHRHDRAHLPRILLMDEPTSSLDVTLQSSILYYIDKLQRKYNIGLLIISHDLPLIFSFCHHIYVMSRDTESKTDPGRIVDHIEQAQKEELFLAERFARLSVETRRLFKMEEEERP